MPVHSEVNQGRCVARVAGDMNIYAAAELKSQLAALLGQAPEVELNLSEVNEFDSAGMQLLLGLKREAAQTGKPLRFTQPSTSVKDVIAIYNLAPEIGASEG